MTTVSLIRKLSTVALGAALFVWVTALAGLAVAAPKTAPVFSGIVSGVAVGGYDPVAYFSAGKPVKGDAAFQLTHEGVAWRFASAANREAFRADPARYAPQYGGYCAWAVAEGYTAKGDPEAWRIVDGKLYLNYNRSVQRTWEKDVPGNVRRGDANWPRVLNK